MVDRPGNDAEDGSYGAEEPSMLGAAAPIAVERTERTGTEGTAVRRRFPPAHAGSLARWSSCVVLVGLALRRSCSGLKKTPRNKVGISYGGGPSRRRTSSGSCSPGSGCSSTASSTRSTCIPADQQNYIVSKAGQGVAGPDSIIAPDADRVQVEYQVAVYFKLNTDRLRAFHEQLGLQYAAYTPSGWNRLIQDTFRQQIENALQEETRQVRRRRPLRQRRHARRVQDGWRRSSATGSWRRSASRSSAAHVQPAGSAATDVRRSRRSTSRSRSCRRSRANRTSQIKVQTRQNEIAQREAEAEAIQALNEALWSQAGEDYVLLRAIESGKIDFWVLPYDSGVTITNPNPTGTAAGGSR